MIEIFWFAAGMHCLGAVTGGISSPNGAGGRGGILSVFRALGVSLYITATASMLNK